MVEPDNAELSIVSQCFLLKISRSGLYYTPKGESAFNINLMHEIDRIYTDYPFYGVRQMCRHINNHLACSVNPKRIRRLMRLVGIMAIYQQPKITIANKEHKRYPYLGSTSVCLKNKQAADVKKENIMYPRELELRKELFAHCEDGYRDFASALIPGCNNLLGVRIPHLRKIAKRLIKENPIEFLENAQDIYFEETMLKGFIIANMRDDIESILEQVSLFIPKITNWSLCDSFCCELKIVRKHKELVWEFLTAYHQSGEAYEIRFAVVMLLFHYIEEKYLNDILLICDVIAHDDYYVKMAVAWAISMCFVKFPNETLAYLKSNNLDKETYNKTLQKICESLRVDKETKAKIKAMRRK